jgi:K+-sensing histidine kinase KdpD
VEPSVLLTIQHRLTALVTAVQVLEEDFEAIPPPQMRARIAAMHRGAFWLHGLIENVLFAATIGDGHLQMHRQSLRMEDVVEEISSVVSPILSQQGQRLETFADERTSQIQADPRRIGQALVNLISNASENSTDGSSVGIGIASRGESVRVSVADRGPALPEDSENALFQSSRQPLAAEPSVYETVGLGLAVARWIVEAHGGTVGARNRRGGGTRFWFELPAATVV